MIRTYSELIKLKTFEERYGYLRLNGIVGGPTFGFDRYLNQRFYKSRRWLQIRDEVVIRDEGCDLGISDRLITGRLFIHHMNPATIEDVVLNKESIFNPEFLICTSFETHLAIHYGDESLLIHNPIIRRPNDTIPWR